MADKRKIIDARGDDDGDTTYVLFEGNTRFTHVNQAMPMAERGEIENTHVVRPRDGRKPHLRTNPNGKSSDNLDDMIGDT